MVAFTYFKVSDSADTRSVGRPVSLGCGCGRAEPEGEAQWSARHFATVTSEISTKGVTDVGYGHGHDRCSAVARMRLANRDEKLYCRSTRLEGAPARPRRMPR